MGVRMPLAGLVCAVLLPISGNAQVYQFATPPPAVTAAGADWQIQGEPIFYAGAYYYPAGPDVFFDGNVMARTGVYRGVPLYEDRTLQPYSVVLVPVGGATMRPYARRESVGAAAVGESGRAVESIEPTGTSGVAAVPPSSRSQSPASTDSGRTIESVPAPSGNRGIFVTFNGERWFSAGRSVTLDPSQLRQVGRYHGFPVYADPGGARDRILIPAVPGGALTPYQR